MDGAEVPTISVETSSLLKEYLICSTKSPSKAYFLRMVLILSLVVLFLTSKWRMAKDPLGTGTRIAFEVNFPFKEGKALATAGPASASVITILSAAARHLRYLLCMLSTKFWSLVYVWRVSKCPFLIPSEFSITFNIWVM